MYIKINKVISGAVMARAWDKVQVITRDHAPAIIVEAHGKRFSCHEDNLSAMPLNPKHLPGEPIVRPTGRKGKGGAKNKQLRGILPNSSQQLFQ